jgi:hypothetical protein
LIALIAVIDAIVCAKTLLHPQFLSHANEIRDYDEEKCFYSRAICAVVCSSRRFRNSVDHERTCLVFCSLSGGLALSLSLSMPASYRSRTSNIRRRSTPLLPPTSPPQVPHTPALSTYVESTTAADYEAYGAIMSSPRTPGGRSSRNTRSGSDWGTFVEIELGLRGQRTKPLRIVKNVNKAEEQQPPPVPPKDGKECVFCFGVKMSKYAKLSFFFQGVERRDGLDLVRFGAVTRRYALERLHLRPNALYLSHTLL